MSLEFIREAQFERIQSREFFPYVNASIFPKMNFKHIFSSRKCTIMHSALQMNALEYLSEEL